MIFFIFIFIYIACELKSEEPKYEEIVSNCRKVLELEPSNFKAHFRLAKSLFHLDDLHGTLEACDEAARNQPGGQPSKHIINVMFF